MQVDYVLTKNPRSERSNVIIEQTLDVCSSLNGTLTSPFSGWFMSIVSNIVRKEYLHPCNHRGGTFYNFTFEPRKVTILTLVKGSFKAYLKFRNAIDANILTTELEFSILSNKRNKL